MEINTCPICDDQIRLKSDGIIQFCKCKCLCIDKTKEYVRYVGVIPKESLLYNWKNKNNDIIKKLKINLDIKEKSI